MKLKKLLPLVLLAIGALFLLTSCDALLDAIYANNSITVNVYVTSSSHFDWNSYGSYAFAQVFDSSHNLVTLTSGLVAYNGSYVWTSFTFPKLKNDTYTVYGGFYSGYNKFDYFAATYNPAQVISFTASSSSITVDAVVP